MTTNSFLEDLQDKFGTNEFTTTDVVRELGIARSGATRRIKNLIRFKFIESNQDKMEFVHRVR